MLLRVPGLTGTISPSHRNAPGQADDRKQLSPDPKRTWAHRLYVQSWWSLSGKKTAVVLCWAEHWTINSYSIPSDWLSHVLLQYNSWTIWTLKFELNFSSNFNITSNAAKEPFPIHTIGSTRASVVICATDIGSASSSCCLEMQARKFAKASSALATRMIITNYKQTDKVKQSLGLVV